MIRACIIARIDAALEKMRFEQIDVRAIYLTEPDRDAFDLAMSKRWAKSHGYKSYRAIFMFYGEHEVRIGKTSTIYSTHGVGVSVPKRLSPRVEALAA